MSRIGFVAGPEYGGPVGVSLRDDAVRMVREEAAMGANASAGVRRMARSDDENFMIVVCFSFALSFDGRSHSTLPINCCCLAETSLSVCIELFVCVL